MQLKSNAPEIKWIILNAAVSSFARDLDQRLLSTGELSQGQIEAVARILLEPPRVAAQVDAAGVTRIVAAFANAVGNGLKRPKMYLGDFLFKLAPAGGRNAGAIYVTEEGEYLGKIANGAFHAVGACTNPQKAAILAVCADPTQAAKAYGQQTGRCSCCGRELTDPESIANSIGPVCAQNYRL